MKYILKLIICDQMLKNQSQIAVIHPKCTPPYFYMLIIISYDLSKLSKD